MSVHVGIDLGTTNSAICSYDGEGVTLYKSPEQTDVTPSAIFMDRRGNRYVGMRAYNASARDPGNAATLFKRLMGTSTPINLPAVDIVMTPEQCSAEILKMLFGYHRHVESVEHDAGLQIGREGPSDDPARPGVENDCEVEKAGQCRQEGGRTLPIFTLRFAMAEHLRTPVGAASPPALTKGRKLYLPASNVGWQHLRRTCLEMSNLLLAERQRESWQAIVILCNL